MNPKLLLAASGAIPLAAAAQTSDTLDPDSIDIVDAIECALDAPAYNGLPWR